MDSVLISHCLPHALLILSELKNVFFYSDEKLYFFNNLIYEENLIHLYNKNQGLQIDKSKPRSYIKILFEKGQEIFKIEVNEKGIKKEMLKGSKENLRSVVTEFFENGNIKCETYWNDDTIEREVYYHENGRKFIDTYFYNKYSRTITYYRNGKVKRDSYDLGDDDEMITRYYKDGSKLSEVYYFNGIFKGFSYYKNGNKKLENINEVRSGLLHQIYYYENGNKRYERDGYETPKKTYYFENGVKRREIFNDYIKRDIYFYTTGEKKLEVVSIHGIKRKYYYHKTSSEPYKIKNY